MGHIVEILKWILHLMYIRYIYIQIIFFAVLFAAYYKNLLLGMNGMEYIIAGLHVEWWESIKFLKPHSCISQK